MTTPHAAHAERCPICGEVIAFDEPTEMNLDERVHQDCWVAINRELDERDAEYEAYPDECCAAFK